MERKQNIENIYTIDVDYGGALYYDSDGAYNIANSDDTIEFYDKDDNLVKKVYVPGIYDWQNEFECKTDAVASTMGSLDAEDWRRRGLALAQEIRNQLPDNCELWFRYPFEDEEHRGEEPFLIVKEQK